MADDSGTKVVQSSIGLPTILFVVFLVLKLTGHITWSWWWVTAPIWIPWSIVLLVALLYVLLKR